MKLESLKRLSMLGLLAVAMALNTACTEKKETGTPVVVVGRDAQAADPNGVTASSAGLKLNGWVVTSPTYQTDFQDLVNGFVDAVLPPNYLGYVAADASGGTGVYIGGKVELQTGVLNTASTARMNIRTDSKIVVVIYDEYTGRTDASGKKVPPVQRYYYQASGYVQGNQVYLKFVHPKFGSVLLEGSFDGTTVTGDFSYDNSVRYDGSTTGTSAGTIGSFQVPTCQFFRCK